MSKQHEPTKAPFRMDRRQLLSGLASSGLILSGAHQAFGQTRVPVTGDTLNSNAALGLAKGKAADNSATWGALFKEQVLRCWKKPYGGIEAQRVEAEFSIKLKKDGMLEAMPAAQTAPGSPFQRVFQESGLRAIIDCAPYRLPPAFFEEWKYFNPVFDSRDL